MTIHLYCILTILGAFGLGITVAKTNSELSIATSCDTYDHATISGVSYVCYRQETE